MNTKKLIKVCAFALMLPMAFTACSDDDDKLNDPNQNPTEQPEDPNEVTVPSVTNLKAEETTKANELQVSWTTPGQAVSVEIAWWKDGTDKAEAEKQNVLGQNTLLVKVAEFGTWHITATAIDNYGNRSEPTEITAIPRETDVPFSWASLADSCTYVLIEQFMDKSKGTFWKTPHNSDPDPYIYWQQAHAIDVVVYAYERIKDTDPERAATYENYIRLWYENDGNNYKNDPNDPTGFLNDYTDDMCWISLTLLHMTEATGNTQYAETAKQVYDSYIITRALTDDKGTGLPWKTGSTSRNACTNSPGCLVAAKLYQRYGDQKYLDDALMLYDFITNNYPLKDPDDGRVEEPPLTYTQGTFGEACRRLYHITGEGQYMRMAERVINYTATSDRCLRGGLLRDEGTSMDQSIFKAVFIPYAVNLIEDESAIYQIRTSLKAFIEKNAESLRTHMNRRAWPEMYCDYWWGSTFSSGTASMGAQTSGASLMEGMARLEAAEQ